MPRKNYQGRCGWIIAREERQVARLKQGNRGSEKARGENEGNEKAREVADAEKKQFVRGETSCIVSERRLKWRKKTR